MARLPNTLRQRGLSPRLTNRGKRIKTLPTIYHIHLKFILTHAQLAFSPGPHPQHSLRSPRIVVSAKAWPRPRGSDFRISYKQHWWMHWKLICIICLEVTLRLSGRVNSVEHWARSTGYSMAEVNHMGPHKFTTHQLKAYCNTNKQQKQIQTIQKPARVALNVSNSQRFIFSGPSSVKAKYKWVSRQRANRDIATA